MADSTTEAPNPSHGSDPSESPIIQLPRKRGRPPGVKNKSKTSDSPESAPILESVPVDPVLIADCIVGLLESADDFWVRAILAAAKRRVGENNWNDFIAEVKKARLGEKDKDSFRKTISVIVQKYTILQKFGPEFVFLLNLGQYLYRMNSLTRLVESLPLLEKPKISPIVEQT